MFKIFAKMSQAEKKRNWEFWHKVQPMSDILKSLNFFCHLECQQNFSKQVLLCVCVFVWSIFGYFNFNIFVMAHSSRIYLYVYYYLSCQFYFVQKCVQINSPQSLLLVENTYNSEYSIDFFTLMSVHFQACLIKWMMMMMVICWMRFYW